MLPDIESIERATLDAVAPHRIEPLPGWLLPFDHTRIARATSAVPLRHADLDPQVLSAIEARYADQRSDCQFRMADVPGLANLHQELQRMGYCARRPVLTQIASTLDWQPAIQSPAAAALSVRWSTSPNEAWESVYLCADFDAEDGAARVRALARSRHAIYGWVSDATGPLAVGTAVLSQGWVSIHGMRTLRRAQGRGLAKLLIAEFFATARSRGLQRAFLQVEEDNLAARRAYQACGFTSAWRYHYWGKE